MSSNEWYTPSKYIEAAREVMGSIDLDPASCEEANRTVKATRYYSKEENGLLLPWYGCVWLNPPYGKVSSGRSNLYNFIQKLVDHYRAGDIEQAITLTTAGTGTKWFQLLEPYLVCFPRGRIRFHRNLAIGPATSNILGSCFAYLGPHEQKFTEVFSVFGPVWKQVSTYKPATLQLGLVIPT
jgi:hypothetical protein